VSSISESGFATYLPEAPDLLRLFLFGQSKQVREEEHGAFGES